MIKLLTDIFKKAVFTNRCSVCGEVIEFNEFLCEDCKNAVRIEPPICLKCGCEKAECICKKSKKSPEYKAVVAPFYYQDSVSKAVLNMKMNGMPTLANEQGRLISDCVFKYYELVEFDCVTYIPMRKYDEKFRGFNQAELLAESVCQNCNFNFSDLLIKKRKTKVQKRQKSSERFVNMYNAFDLKDGADVDGKTILLIDDVKTTGATLSSAAMTLKAYGAKDVYCAVFAIVK